MAEYYPPSEAGLHYGYYQPPPPPPPGGVSVPPAPPAQPYIPQAQPQPPPFTSYVAPFPAYGSYDEVRTLFVAGLPEDVKPREIYNLFREFPGYESSHLRSPTQNSQPFAFAVFSDQQSALGAMHAINGMVFDLEKGSTLYIDLAKSNSRSKRSRPDDEWTGLDKKARGSSAFPRVAPDSGFGSVHMPGMGNSAYNMIGYPHTQSHANFDARGASEITAAKLDTASSTAALNNLQGTILYSSLTSDGMRLEYAKSRMGMPRKPK